MTKSAVADWSTTASNNTDVGGVSLAEGMNPAGVNDAMREIMAQVVTHLTPSTGLAQAYGGTGDTVLGGALVTPTGGAEDSLADHLGGALFPIATGGSVGRSLAAHMGDKLSPLDRNAAGDGSTNDATPLQALMTAGFFFGNPNKTYAFASALTIGTTGAVIYGTLKLKLTSSISGDTPALLITGNDVSIDTLELTVASGVTVARAIRVNGTGFRFRRIKVTYTDQQGVNDGTDAAVIFTGSDIRGDLIEVKKHDVGVNIVSTATDFDIEKIIVRTTLQGVSLNASDGRIGTIDARGLSANSAANPGENAATITNVSDVYIGAIISEDAGEHGVYVGGGGTTYGGAYSTTGDRTAGLNIGEIIVRRSGQTALKIKANQHIHERITVGSLYFEDAAFGTSANANEDGVRIEGCRGVTIGSITGRGTFNKTTGAPTRSCYYGVYLESVQRVDIGPVDIDTTASHLVYIRDDTDHHAVSGNAAVACSDITFQSLTGRDIGGDAFYINSPRQNFGRIYALEGAIHVVAGVGLRIVANSTTTGVTSPCKFAYDLTAVTGAASVTNTSDADLHIDIVVES